MGLQVIVHCRAECMFLSLLMAHQLCDICGAIGYAELIATCSKCKVVREHIYCMPINLHDFPKFWLCEQCALDEAKIPDNSGFQVQPRMLKQAGKVKFIPTEEVIELSSGGMAFGPPRTSIIRKGSASSMPQPHFQVPKKFQERSSAFMHAKDCGVKKQASAACVPSSAVQTSKKAKVADKLSETASTSSVARHGLSDMVTGKRALLASVKLKDTQKQSKRALISSKELVDFNEVKNAVKNSACRTSSTHHLPIDRSVFGKDRRCAEEPMDVTEGVKKVKNKVPSVPLLTPSQTHIGTAGKDVENAKNKASSVPSPMHPLWKMGSGGSNYASVKNKNFHNDGFSQNAGAKIIRYRRYLPASDVSWMGGFRMVDPHTAGEFYGGFWAKPPCEVHRRTYELLRQMPSVLPVTLLNRLDIWDDLFHNDRPDLGDIGLYFFPSDNIERSNKNISCLFELMERENLLIKSSLHGAELLIFTSKQLNVDSQYFTNRLSPKCLLLGVFRKSKNIPSLNAVRECTAASPPCSSVSSVERPSPVPRLESTFNRQRIHDDRNFHINKMGVNDTGKLPSSSTDLDSTIQQLLLEFGPQKPMESDVKTLTVTNNVKREPEEATPISAIGSYSFSLLKIKAESFPGAKVEGFEDQKCLETGECKRAESTFSLEGSQNGSRKWERAASERVTDKYLQMFNTGIKKEPH